jgi:metallo-beta-lactamase class B
MAQAVRGDLDPGYPAEFELEALRGVVYNPNRFIIQKFICDTFKLLGGILNHRTVFFWLAILAALLSACSAVMTPTAAPTAVPTLPDPLPGMLAPDLSVEKLADGVFVIQHAYPWPANSLVVRMANGEILLVDTPYTPEATQILLDWVSKSFEDAAVTAIVTGYHADNLGGVPALLGAGIAVYGSDLTADFAVSRLEHQREMMVDLLVPGKEDAYISAYQEMIFSAPDHTFPLAEGLTLTFGTEEVQVIYPGFTQSEDKVVVYFPQRKGLFGGCAILSADRVGNSIDADMNAWPESLKTLLALELEWVVPGHGERRDPGLIAHTIEVLEKDGITRMLSE